MNEPPVEHGPNGEADGFAGTLRQAFARATVPGAPPALRASLERLPSTVARDSHGPWRTAAARQPVALVAMVAVLVVGLGLASRGPEPAASPPLNSGAGPSAVPSTRSPAASGPIASVAGMIPWVDASPPVAASPTPRPVPAGTRSCAPADLAATAGWQGATGSMAGGIRVTNRGSTACVIDGPPRLAVIRAGSRIMATDYLAANQADLGGGAAPGPGLLEPGDVGGWWLLWENWCGSNLTPATVELTLPDGSGPLVARPAASRSVELGSRPRCDAPASPSTLTVTAFAYRPPEPPLVVAQPASTTIVAPATAVIGRDLTFTVTLRNLGEQPAIFDPCPTYTEDLIVGGLRLKRPTDQSYALNCAAMGRALAPGASITLAMRFPIPESVPPGPAELLWSLDPGGPFDTRAFGRVPIDIVTAPAP
jgi:hypothetical protein